jgi:hypothetical protein
MHYWRHYHARADHRPRLRAGRVVPLIWRPDLPLLYVTVFMGRLPSQRCRRQSQCGRGYEQDSHLLRAPRQSVADDATLTELSKLAMQIRQTIP